MLNHSLSRADFSDAARVATDEAYLEQIATLSFDDVTWDPESIRVVRDFLAGWHHNIMLADGIYTAYCEDYYVAHEEIMRIVSDGVSGDFVGKRVLDIGCLEGYFASECALQGADVVAIDGRLLNIKKCEFVKSVLGVANLHIIQDDAMAVTQEKYGSFDVVLALGILYHLADPFTFLENISKLCTGFVVIDTLIAMEDLPESIADGWTPPLSSLKEFVYHDKSYSSRLYQEFDTGATQVEKDLSRTAALANEFSIWLTEESLIQLLREVGFEQVEKLVYGKQEDMWWADVERQARVLLRAVTCRAPFHSKIFRS